MEERAFSEGCLGENVVHADIVKAVFIDFPKSDIEDFTSGFHRIAGSLFHMHIIYRLVCICQACSVTHITDYSVLV